MAFLKPPKGPRPPPSSPQRADASVFNAGQQAAVGMPSLVGTGATEGLSRKAKTRKQSLIGGS